MTDANLSKDITTGFAALFAGQAAGVQGLLARTQGAVLNPNTELLFQGPALRAFTFNFKLSPRSQKEAKIVRSIIRFFKQGMAVQRTEKDLFLKAPHLFRLSFLKNDNDPNPFLPKTKLEIAVPNSKLKKVITTIINMRAPGLTFHKIPLFV